MNFLQAVEQETETDRMVALVPVVGATVGGGASWGFESKRFGQWLKQ